ncbi:hypothetical protein A1F94_011111 [Pyrenophora tritici-repentis]|nr:hypothetical protein A1F94_011111 [Pyrenophora tritici-repentis]
MLAADYIHILKKIERDTASCGEWRLLSKKMVAALPERLYRQYPSDLQEVAQEKRIVRPTAWNNDFPNPEYSSFDSSDSEEESEDNEEEMDDDLEQHNNNASFPSLPPDRDRINAFRALKNFTQTPFGNGMSGLRSETLFDLSAKKVGINGELIKVDSWRLAEVAQSRLDWETEQYNMEDFDVYDDEDGRVEIYGPKAVDNTDTEDEFEDEEFF